MAEALVVDHVVAPRIAIAIVEARLHLRAVGNLHMDAVRRYRVAAGPNAEVVVVQWHLGMRASCHIVAVELADAGPRVLRIRAVRPAGNNARAVPLPLKAARVEVRPVEDLRRFAGFEVQQVLLGQVARIHSYRCEVEGIDDVTSVGCRLEFRDAGVVGCHPLDGLGADVQREEPHRMVERGILHDLRVIAGLFECFLVLCFLFPRAEKDTLVIQPGEALHAVFERGEMRGLTAPRVHRPDLPAACRGAPGHVAAGEERDLPAIRAPFGAGIIARARQADGRRLLAAVWVIEEGQVQVRLEAVVVSIRVALRPEDAVAVRVNLRPGDRLLLDDVVDGPGLGLLCRRIRGKK